MKTVTIKTRAVYHKIAEVTIEIPDYLKPNEVHQWIQDNENMFVDELDQNLRDAPMEYGFGLGKVFDEIESVYETRFDVYENGQITWGGHYD
jgi:hypothetical protein